MERGEQLYLEPWKSAPGCSILHYCCFWTVQAEDFHENILDGVILVYNRYSEQSVCEPKKGPREALYHQEIFKNRWLLTSFYATRNVDCIPGIKIKHNFFKNNFFPSTIIEWNKLVPAIRNAESFGIFKSNILKFSRPTPSSFFNCCNHFILHNHSPEHSKQNWLQINRDEWISFNRNATVWQVILWFQKKLPHSFLMLHWLHSVY